MQGDICTGSGRVTRTRLDEDIFAVGEHKSAYQKPKKFEMPIRYPSRGARQTAGRVPGCEEEGLG